MVEYNLKPSYKAFQSARTYVITINNDLKNSYSKISTNANLTFLGQDNNSTRGVKIFP